MKKHIFLCLLFAFIMSCQHNDKSATISPSSVKHSSLRAPSTACNVKTVPLIAGQNINVGTLEIANSPDAQTIYVTYNLSAPGWVLGTMHLFVGECGKYPQTKKGIPIPGQFPYSFSPTTTTTNYTFTIPASAIAKDASGCFCVYAHAEVKKLDANGNVIQEETAWGGNTPNDPSIPRWFFFTNYCPQTCSPPPTGKGTCSLSQGYWFAKPQTVWAGGSVTVGGHTYTQAEGKALWAVTGSSGVAQCFFQVSAIKLSGVNLSLFPDLKARVDACEACLRAMPKLTPSTVTNSGCGSDGGWIGDWIDANHCEE